MFFRNKEFEEMQLLKEKIAQLEMKSGEQQKMISALSFNALAPLDKFRSSSRPDFEEFYLAFEDRFRGAREEIKRRLTVYLPYLQRLRDVFTDPILLDAGCGRGEWLELVSEEGYCARGIDSNSVAVSRCRSLMLDVVESDAVDWLSVQETASFDCMTAFHLVEHLAPDTLLELIHEAFRVLKPGGLLILETPDPENIEVSSHSFYYDPTHRNPLPAATLVFIAEYAGFGGVELLRQHKLADTGTTGNQQVDEVVRRFNMTQDYSVIALKPEKRA